MSLLCLLLDSILAPCSLPLAARACRFTAFQPPCIFILDKSLAGCTSFFTQLQPLARRFAGVLPYRNLATRGSNGGACGVRCWDATLLQEAARGASQGLLGGVFFLCPLFVFRPPTSEMLLLCRRWCNSQTLENPLFISLQMWYTEVVKKGR